VNKLKHSN